MQQHVQRARERPENTVSRVTETIYLIIHLLMAYSNGSVTSGLLINLL